MATFKVRKERVTVITEGAETLGDDAQEKEIIEEEREKRGWKPMSKTDCAAEGCAMQGVPTSTLKACAGKCPQDLKPHYCSKACQKQVPVVSLPNL